MGRSPYLAAHASCAARMSGVGFGLRWRALGSSNAPTQGFLGPNAARAASRRSARLAAARFARSRSACALAWARLSRRTGWVLRRDSWPRHTLVILAAAEACAPSAAAASASARAASASAASASALALAAAASAAATRASARVIRLRGCGTRGCTPLGTPRAARALSMAAGEMVALDAARHRAAALDAPGAADTTEVAGDTAEVAGDAAEIAGDAAEVAGDLTAARAALPPLCEAARGAAAG